MTILVKGLSLEMAKGIADAAELKAAEQNLKIVIAIMDAHGNLRNCGVKSSFFTINF